MSNTDSKSVLDVIKSLGRGEGLTEAVKEAGLLEEVTEETTEEKVAESTVEEDVVEEPDPELVQLAEKVAKILDKKEPEELDKVAILVEKLNKEAEEVAASQEIIITSLFNATCLEKGAADAAEIIKMAAEEDSPVADLVKMLYKYAETADSILGEEYVEDYDENDVIKLATIIIESTENPFELEEAVEETKEAEEVSEVDTLAAAIVKQLKESN